MGAAACYLHGAPMSGLALKEWRETHKWTQAQASDWYGVHERTWRRYEGRPALPMRLWKRIVEYNQLKREQ